MDEKRGSSSATRRTVSVAMAVYQPDPAFLEEQLESIRNQVDQPDEVVISDDCSPDGAYGLIENYIAEHGLSTWRLVSNVGTRGVRGNFEACIAHCGGDVIVLCDQDDVWLPGKIARLRGLFEAHPEVKSVVGNYRLINGRSEFITVGESGDNPYFRSWECEVDEHLYHVELSCILAHNLAPGATQAFSSDVRELFLDEHKHDRMHDWRINIIAAYAFNGLFYLDEVLTWYRLHGSNTVGLHERYLELPERQPPLARLRWMAGNVKFALGETWRNRHAAYGTISSYELGGASIGSNTPEIVEDCYGSLCRMDAACKDDYAGWVAYSRAMRCAVDERSLPQFAKIRMAYPKYQKEHYWQFRWPDRLGCALRDFWYCVYGGA